MTDHSAALATAEHVIARRTEMYGVMPLHKLAAAVIAMAGELEKLRIDFKAMTSDCARLQLGLLEVQKSETLSEACMVARTTNPIIKEPPHETLVPKEPARD